MKILYTIALTFLMSFSLIAQEFTYDFNDLELGDVNGQDNWVTVVNSAGSPNEMDVAYNYQGAVSYDGTRAVFYGQSGGNNGRTGSRTSHDNFPFDFTLGGPVQIEVDIHTGYWGTLFGFGYDANNNGYLMKAIETVVNIENNEGGFGFHLGNASGNNPAINSFFMPDGSTIPYTFPLAELSGWHRYKIFIDLDANDGAGSITMFVAEMEGDFVAVSEISDLNLGMTSGTGTNTDPAMWTKIFLHATGGTSGFDNLLIDQPDTGGLLYQYLTFNPLNNHLTSDAPFAVNAVSNQGLEVSFEIVEGPATINGNMVSLTGEAGMVIVKAYQDGNDEVAAADPVNQSFEIYDPADFAPELEVRNGADDTEILMPVLMYIPLSVSTEIEHPDLLGIQSVSFMIDGNTIDAVPTHNGFFIANWTPGDYGIYDMTTNVTSTGGVSSSKSTTFTVLEEAPDMEYKLIEDYDFSVSSVIDTTLTLPSFVGAYTTVTAVLDYGCPCDPWDRVASVDIRGANGEWMQLFKYITPYGVACSDQIDITDFVSQLQGRVDVRMNFAESITTITLVYEAGTPEYNYSWMDNLWQDHYVFGDMNNLQPVEILELQFNPNIEKAVLRMQNGGFGWGENNSQNAAEFYNGTHNININGTTEFEQNLWQDCNPNPAGCQPQNGTWYHDRHGWCPGSMAVLHQYDLSEWIDEATVDLQFELDPSYIDYCSSSNPNCVSGSTCPDCNDTYLPNIAIAGGLVTYSNSPVISAIKNIGQFKVQILPNPSNGIFTFYMPKDYHKAEVQIYSITGAIIGNYNLFGSVEVIDISSYPSGIYFANIKINGTIKTEKIIIQK